MEIGVPVITMCSTGGHPAIQQFPRPSTIAMAGNKSFHGCFQVFIKNSWGISIITAWMSIGNLPSLKIMHPTWAEILWHKFVKFYRCLYSWGANLPPPPPPYKCLLLCRALSSLVFNRWLLTLATLISKHPF